jgi:hypothetical protein
VFFGLLGATSVPRLQNLRLIYNESRFPAGQRVVFDPYGWLAGPEDLVLKDALASQLQTVEVEWTNVDVNMRASSFLALFGVANRTEVLRVLPDSVELVDETRRATPEWPHAVETRMNI